MAEKPGYPLPIGPAYTDNLACSMIFYPDMPEYRRALRASLHYLGTWLAWERDDDKRGQDAARAWKEANDLTEECLEMNVCTQMIDLLTEIRDNQLACCATGSTNITYGDNIIVTTTIVPGQGTAPTLWGEQPIADWDEWQEYVCGAAHDYVDDLINTIEQLSLPGTIVGVTFDFIAHLFSLVQWRMVEDLIPVNFSVIAAIINAIGEGFLALDFDAIAQNVEAGRDDIVCSLMIGTSLEDAVEASIDNQVIWDVFFQWLDYETTTAAIYHGEVPNHGYLTPIQRQDCDCFQFDGLAEWTFDASAEGWIFYLAAPNGEWQSGRLMIIPDNSYARVALSTTQAKAGTTSGLDVDIVKVEYDIYSNTLNGETQWIQVHDGTQYQAEQLPTLTPHTETFEFPSGIRWNYNNSFKIGGSQAGSCRYYIDNVKIWFKEV